VNRLKPRVAKIDPQSRVIHGQCSELPPGFVLVQVPYRAKFANDPEPEKHCWSHKLRQILQALSKDTPFHVVFKDVQRSDGESTIVASNYSLVKVLAAVAQSLFGIATLYDTKGDQIQRYGYAAFGLTVIPHAYMSLVNLVANLMSPEYPAMYLVESQAMRDAMEILYKGEEVELASINVASVIQSNPACRPDVSRQSYPESQSGPMSQPPSAPNVAAPLQGESTNHEALGQARAQSREELRINQQGLDVEVLTSTEGDAGRVARSIPPQQKYFNGVIGALEDEWIAQWERKISHHLASFPVERGDIKTNTYGRLQWSIRIDLKDFKGDLRVYWELWKRQIKASCAFSASLATWVIFDLTDIGVEDLENTPSASDEVQEHVQGWFPTYIRYWKWVFTVTSPSFCLAAFGIYAIGFVGLLAPLAINGALSLFHPGLMSTNAQELWIIIWLGFGISVGMIAGSNGLVPFLSTRPMLEVIGLVIFGAAPAVGGMVVVAQMMLEYGVCMKIT